MRCPFISAILLLCALAGPVVAADPMPLFDGKTLEGFRQIGGKASFEVVDGSILGGTIPNQPNSFLRTEREYGDFILEYEFKIDERLNSGVQIRSLSIPEYRNGVVHGYQIEIDPDVARGRLWTAGIYDESRRGWLAPIENNPAARAAFKPNDWNHIRVEAIGDSIKTWLNGVPAADLVDSMTLSGFIALQVHGIGNRQDGPFHVAWRNLNITDLGRHVWKPLFDGRTLANFKPSSDARSWQVRDGMLIGTSKASEDRHSILLTEQDYDDFTVRIVYKAISGNSGLYFRATPVDEPYAVRGFQAEIDAGGAYPGGLYETAGRGWVAQPPEELTKRAFKPGDWNEMTVSARGRRIVIHLNGEKTVDLLDDQGARSGRIGLQLHGGQDMHIEVKSVDLLVKE